MNLDQFDKMMGLAFDSSLNDQPQTAFRQLHKAVELLAEEVSRELIRIETIATRKAIIAEELDKLKPHKTP